MSSLHLKYKKSLIIASIISICFGCGKKESTFTIQGKIVNNNNSSKIWIMKRLLPTKDFEFIDSILINKDGRFSYLSNDIQPSYYQLYYSDSINKVSAPLLLESCCNELTVLVDTFHFGVNENKIKTRKISVGGSEANDKLDLFFEANRRYYTEFTSPLRKRILEITKQNTRDFKELDSLNSLLKKYQDLRHKDLKGLILDSLGTSISIYQTMSQWDFSDFDLIDTVVHRFKSQKPNSFITPHIIAKAEDIKSKSLIGKQAINFELRNPEGVSIQSEKIIKRRIVLLDFWASWCGPCLREFPSYRKVYQQYHDKGFEIISISTDKNVNDWKKLSLQLELPWINVLDDLDDENTLSKTYGIVELPTNYLIDKNGIIIRKNITQLDLIKYLESSLKK